MAKETLVLLTDDIDGSEASEELTFGLRGVEYEIDLSAKNVAALEKALAKYVAAGRKVNTRAVARRGAAGRPSPAAAKEELTAIREWARTNGYRVADRGRVSAEIREAYAAAN